MALQNVFVGYLGGLIFMLFISTVTSEIQVKLCKTDSTMENCDQTMPVDQVGNYPISQHDEALFFKIVPTAGQHSGTLWPVRCHLLNFEEHPDGSNLIINNGCPVRPQMSLNMNRDPVMVKFLLSELTRQRPIQQSVSLKCFVAACKMNSLNLSEACPRSHFCENRVDSHLWASRWTNRLQEANSAGYLLLNEEPALEHEPAHVTNIGYGDFTQNHCATLLRQLQRSCPLQALELINIVH